MPRTKQPKTEEEKPKTARKPRVVKVAAQEVEPAQQLEQQVDAEQPTRRAGRTLLVKSTNGALNDQLFNGMTGLLNRAETKTTNSVFLTFDTAANSSAAFDKLSSNSSVRVKYSYYRIFFTMTGLTDTSDYNQVKSDLIQHVESKANTSVLYCKLYRKETKFLGCGDFTVDTLSGMNALLSKDVENSLKNYTLGSLSGTFYRFNTNRGTNTMSASS